MNWTRNFSFYCSGRWGRGANSLSTAAQTGEAFRKVSINAWTWSRGALPQPQYEEQPLRDSREATSVQDLGVTWWMVPVLPSVTQSHRTSCELLSLQGRMEYPLYSLKMFPKIKLCLWEADTLYRHLMPQIPPTMAFPLKTFPRSITDSCVSHHPSEKLLFPLLWICVAPATKWASTQRINFRAFIKNSGRQTL